MKEDVTVRCAFDLFLRQPGRGLSTKQKYRQKLKLFLEKYGDVLVTAVSVDVLEAWFVFLEQRGYSPGHLAFHRSCFVTFFGFCNQWLGHNPARSLPRFSQKPGQVIVANEADVERALRVCEVQMWQSIVQQRDAAIFALGTVGLRRSNVKQLCFSQTVCALANPVSLFGQTVCILNAEGKESMEAVLDERRAKILRRYVQNRPQTRHNRLFVVLNRGHPNYLRPLSEQGFQRARQRVCELAGVPVISFQKMRRLVGTKVARKQGVAVAAHVLGHRSGVRVILDHYYDPDREAARFAVLETFL